MAFNFFENSIATGMSMLPNNQYREDEQALITDQWINTTAIEEIEEQDFENENFDNFTFHTTNAWLNTIVGLSTTGSKDSYDFVQLIFEDLEHQRVEGRYYKFHNNFWIEYNDDRTASVVSHISVRRCNNFLKIQDPENSGEIYSIPCVVGYDMSSPSSRVTNSIITPNNHATVIVQQNSITSRLFKTNTRFLLSGRPFKLYGYQNAVEQFPISGNFASLMQLDLYLDEFWDEDDLENGVAWNGWEAMRAPDPLEEDLILTPYSDKIKEFSTVNFDIYMVHEGESFVPDDYTISIDNPNLIINAREDNKIALYCSHRTSSPVKVTIVAYRNSPSLEISKDFYFYLTSMIG